MEDGVKAEEEEEMEAEELVINFHRYLINSLLHKALCILFYICCL